MGVIIFNGVPSTDFGIEVSACPDYVAAERDFTSVEVPGRNGSLHIDNGRFKNVERVYSCSFAQPGWVTKKRFFTPAAAISAWLNSAVGYARLEDTYDGLVYRLARYNGTLNIKSVQGMAGTMDISFDCQPERFLKDGEDTYETSSGIELFNPTSFAAKPRIEIFGTGVCNLYVGSALIIVDLRGYSSAVVDCYYREVYSGLNNLNFKTKMYGDDFPSLPPGRSRIGFNGSGITKVKITPNWWTL